MKTGEDITESILRMDGESRNWLWRWFHLSKDSYWIGCLEVFIWGLWVRGNQRQTSHHWIHSAEFIGITSRPNPTVLRARRDRRERKRTWRKHKRKLESVAGRDIGGKKEAEEQNIIEKETEKMCLNICFEWYDSAKHSIYLLFIRFLMCSKH